MRCNAAPQAMVNRCSRSRRHEPGDKNTTKHAIKCHTHGSQTKQHERSTCSRPKYVHHAMCACRQTLVHFTAIHDCRAATNAQWLNNATSAAYTCSMLAPTHACLRTTSTPTHAAVNPRTRKPNSCSAKPHPQGNTPSTDSPTHWTPRPTSRGGTRQHTS